MAISQQRKAEIDALINRGGSPRAAPLTSGITSQRRAEIQAMLGGTLAPKTQQVPGPATTSQSGFLRGLVQGVTELPRKAISGVLGAGEATVDLLKGDTKAALEASNKERDFGYFGKARPFGYDEQGKALSNLESAKQAVGAGLEAFSYVVPSVGAAKVAGKAAAQAPKIGALAKFGRFAEQKVLPEAFNGGIMGGAGAAGQELQKKDSTLGSVLKKGLGGTALGFGTGAALPLIGGAINQVAKGAKKVTTEFLGKSTGAGEFSVREAFDNPAVIGFARRAGKEGPDVLQSEALDEARLGLIKLKEARRSAYIKDLEKVVANPADLTNALQTARQNARQQMLEIGARFGEGKNLNNLDLSGTAITRNEKTIERAFNDLMSWTDTSVKGLDTLKKRLSDHVSELKREGGNAYVASIKMLDDVRGALNAAVPEYEKMTAGYHEASDLIDEITKALSLGDKASKDTAFNKITGILRQNKELRRELLGSLSNASGKDILAKLAGAQLGTLAPRGLAGAIFPTSVAGVSAVLNVNSLPFFMMMLASSSPRLVAEFASLMGRVSGKTIPIAIKQQMARLIIQAEREASSQDQTAQ